MAQSFGGLDAHIRAFSAAFQWGAHTETVPFEIRLSPKRHPSGGWGLPTSKQDV